MNDGSAPGPTNRSSDAAPIFDIIDSDGQTCTIDLSVPGGWGDFAFNVMTGTAAASFQAYHTGEASIFIKVLQAMKLERDAATTLADLGRLRLDVRTRTDRRAAATETSQNAFSDGQLLQLAGAPTESRYDYTTDYRGRQLEVTATTAGVRFEMTGDTVASDRVLTVPQSDLWRFAAGMMWRSFGRPGHRAPQLTRLSTAAYDNALDAFERGLRTAGG